MIEFNKKCCWISDGTLWKNPNTFGRNVVDHIYDTHTKKRYRQTKVCYDADEKISSNLHHIEKHSEIRPRIPLGILYSPNG